MAIYIKNTGESIIIGCVTMSTARSGDEHTVVAVSTTVLCIVSPVIYFRRLRQSSIDAEHIEMNSSLAYLVKSYLYLSYL